MAYCRRTWELSVMNYKIATNRSVVFGLELLLALPLSLVLARLGIGGIAWMLGSIISGALVVHAYRVLYKYQVEPNRTAREIGQALIGLVIGFSIAKANLAVISLQLPIFAFLTLFMLLGGSVIGYIYSRISQTNLLTAMLATVPGSVGIMASLAADYGRNVPLVALVQIIRLTTVIFLIPLVARVLVGSNTNTLASDSRNDFFYADQSYLSLLLLVLVVTLLGVHLGKILRVPAASFFGSLIVGATFNALLNWLPLIPDLDFNPPLLINLIGQILLGITIGEYWGSKPALGKRTIVFGFISVAMTIGVGLIAAVIALVLTPWDWLTCMLVTAPGGAPEMILVALAFHHDVEIVTTGHLVRLIAINGFLPVWVFLFRYLDRHLPSSSRNQSCAD